MNPISKDKYDEAIRNARKAQDSLSRAIDGMTERNWDHLELGYAQGQLLRANRAIIEVIVQINNEVNGEREGEPHNAKSE